MRLRSTPHRVLARTAPTLLVAVAALAVAGCGLVAGDESGDASDAPAETREGRVPSADGEGASYDADAPWPRTVTNCGREVTVDQAPERVVGFEGAAETVLALGVGDRMVGYFGNAPDALPADLAAQTTDEAYRGGSFPSPQLEAMLAPEPDLLLLYGYNEEAGVTQERLDELGVPHLLLSEACPTDADATVEGYFADVATFAHALGADDAGTALLEGWRDEIAAATSTPVADPPSVFVNGNVDPAVPFASGGGSLADDQLRIAGATNAFGDTDDAFLEPSWEEVASRDPDVIVDGSGGLQESLAALRAYLVADPALSQLAAVRDDALVAIDYYENVPGPRVVDGIVSLAEIARR